MFEIQKVVILFTIFCAYIHAQDVQKVGANIKVEDPFAKPDVDPFASMKNTDNSKSSNADSTVTRTSRTQTVIRNRQRTSGNTQGGTTGSGNTVIGGTRTGGKSQNTQEQQQNQDIRRRTQELNQNTDSMSQGTRTVQNTRRTSSNVQRTSQGTRQQNPVVSGNNVKVSNAETTVNAAATSDRRTRIVGSGRGLLRKASSGSTKTEVKSSASLGNTQSTDTSRGSQTNNLRQASIGNMQDNVNRQGSNRITQSEGVNTRTTLNKNQEINRNEVRISENEIRGSRNDRRRFNAGMTNELPGINLGTTTEQPNLFIRKLYRDQSICERNCFESASDCYLGHPDDCRQYIRCSTSSAGGRMEALEMDCAFGTFWSDVANTCDVASDVVCKKDKCQNTQLKSYPSGLNCRSYWRCVNGRSDAECCPEGEAYVDGYCVPSETCNIGVDECPYKYQLAKKEEETVNACHLQGIPGNETAFRYNEHIMTCPDGTKFDRKTCGCITSVFRRVRCKADLNLGFEGTDVVNRGRNYIENSNVTVLRPKNTPFARFNGRAFISVPYFKSNEQMMRTFVIRLRFIKNDNQGYDSQVLASNCKTQSGTELSPSFAILLSMSQRKIIFFASTKKADNSEYGATADIGLDYTPSKWTVVELKFVDEVLSAKVETLESDGQSSVQEQQKVLKGTLTKSVNSLMIGNCNVRDGFVGYIDQATAYACDPDQV